MKDDNLTDEEQAKLDEVSRLTKEANKHYRAVLCLFIQKYVHKETFMQHMPHVMQSLVNK